VRFTGGTFSLPQLEAGSTATEFAHRSKPQEMNLCIWFYQLYTVNSSLYGAAGSSCAEAANFPEMRGIPTIAIIVSGSFANVTSTVQDNATTNSARIGVVPTATGITAITARVLSLSAEL